MQSALSSTLSLLATILPLPWPAFMRGRERLESGSKNVMMREIQSEHNIYDGLKVKRNEETNNWFSQGEGEVAATGVQEPSPQVESVYLPT